MRFFVDAVGEFRKDIDILALQPEMFTDDDSLAEVEQSTSHSAGLVVGYEPW